MSRLPSSSLSALLSVKLGGASLDVALQQIVDVAKSALDGVEEVSITLVRADKPFTAAYTGQLALDADEMQYDRGYGPCIDAGLSGTLIVVPDMRQETRWPDYAATVVPRGVLSSMSVPLPLQTEVVGALNCYSRTAGGFPDETIETAIEVASHVAATVGNAVTYTETAKLADDMQAAMASRAVIEQAKGVIMAQNRCTADEAFDILRKASQDRNVKLRQLAADIVGRVGSGSPG